MNQVKKELMKELKAVHDNRDFVCGTVRNAASEAAWLDMLEYIHMMQQQGKEVLSDDLLILSVAMGEKYEKQNGIKPKQRKIAAAVL